MGIYADTSILESPCPESPDASILSNREVSLLHAITVTRSLEGKSVFRVSAVFRAFLDAGSNTVLRRRALAHAVDIRRNRFQGTVAAGVIVSAARDYLSIIESTGASA